MDEKPEYKKGVNPTWRIACIFFIMLVVLASTIMLWANFYASSEIERMEECWYDVCSEYDDSELYGNDCYCYNFNEDGDYEIVFEKYIK